VFGPAHRSLEPAVRPFFVCLASRRLDQPQASPFLLIDNPPMRAHYFLAARYQNSTCKVLLNSPLYLVACKLYRQNPFGGSCASQRARSFWPTL
jgi:hypothetical protein